MKIAVFGLFSSTRVAIETFLELGCEIILLFPSDQRHLFTQFHFHTLSIPVHFFDSIHDPDLIDALREFEPDYIISYVFGTKIPQSIVRLAGVSALNIHPSALPQYRSGNAWFWPVREGETTSMLTVHHLEEKWDSGNIVFEYPFTLPNKITQGIYIRLVESITSDMIRRLHAHFLNETTQNRPQGEGRYFPKLRFKDILIDWPQDAVKIEALIRACNPTHLAKTYLHNKMISIGEANITGIQSKDIPGTLLVRDDTLYASTGSTLLELTIIEVIDEGLFSAARFIDIYGIKNGQHMISIKTLPFMQEFLETML